MSTSISRTEKKGRGRPRTNPTSIHLTVPPDLLALIDRAAADHGAPSRPELIRRAVAEWLAAKGYVKE
jgi:metal-responsive CopG/Arc/MetJ family transcriptional regulator